MTRAQQTAMMSVVYVVLGVLGVIWVLNDIFKQVLVPRAVQGTNRISIFLARFAFAFARNVVAKLTPARREDLLGVFAPLYFVVLLGLWLFALMLSYGLVLYGLRESITPEPPNYLTAVYFAGTSLLTGFGAFSPNDGAVRTVSIFAAVSGVGTVAVAITFLYAIIAAFQERERFVVVLDARAGAPASGVALLETYGALGMMSELSTLFRDSELWTADVLDSHLAYPILMAFRSSHKDESWIAALGALLDAATLLVTVSAPDHVPIGAARLFLDIGTHLTHDLDAYFDLFGRDPEPTTPAQRETIRTRLERVGYRIRDDDESWKQFDELRGQYVKTLDGIGRRWLHATAQLIGERTALPGHN